MARDLLAAILEPVHEGEQRRHDRRVVLVAPRVPRLAAHAFLALSDLQRKYRLPIFHDIIQILRLEVRRISIFCILLLSANSS